MLFAAARFYGFGKTFFWPTTLGVVSEQYPARRRAMLNAIAGVGMISVGTIGNPAIGTVQDRAMASRLQASDPVVAERVVETRQGLFGESPAVNPAKRADLAAEAAANPGNTALQQQAALVATTDQHTKQGTLGAIAILPAIMLACYVGLLCTSRRTADTARPTSCRRRPREGEMDVRGVTSMDLRASSGSVTCSP